MFDLYDFLVILVAALIITIFGNYFLEKVEAEHNDKRIMCEKVCHPAKYLYLEGGWGNGSCTCGPEIGKE